MMVGGGGNGNGDDTDGAGDGGIKDRAVGGVLMLVMVAVVLMVPTVAGWCVALTMMGVML